MGKRNSQLKPVQCSKTPIIADSLLSTNRLSILINMVTPISEVSQHAGDSELVEHLKSLSDDWKNRLERQDLIRISQIKTDREFQEAIENLKAVVEEIKDKSHIIIFFHRLNDYLAFINNLDKVTGSVEGVAMFRGLLYVTVDVCFQRGQAFASARKKIKTAGERLRGVNQLLGTLGWRSTLMDVRSETAFIAYEVAELWLLVIKMLRNPNPDGNSRPFSTRIHSGNRFTTGHLELDVNEQWEELSTRIESFERMLAGIVNPQCNYLQGLTVTQSLQFAPFQDPHPWQHLRPSQILYPNRREQIFISPSRCYDIPAKNERFVNRKDILKSIEEELNPPHTTLHAALVILHGIRGVGKTQIALQYAYDSMGKFDIVLWILSESESAMKQRLTDIALHTLHLPEANSQRISDTIMRLIDWFQNTTSKWLMIFDNAKSIEMLRRYWPKSPCGSILVTTNSPRLASLGSGKAVEVQPFSQIDGAYFLLDCLELQLSDNHLQTAKDLADRLGGHALGISQSAAIIRSRQTNMAEFLRDYDFMDRKLYLECVDDWEPHNYDDNTVGTIWELAFMDLRQDEQTCLGILSFLTSHSIPQSILLPPNVEALDEHLQFCQDHRLNNILLHLSHHALISVDSAAQTLSVHCLIQAEFRVYNNKDRQKNFDAALLLLLQVFPSRKGSRIDDRDWPVAARYFPQALSLINNYRREQPNIQSSKNLCELICDVLWYLYINNMSKDQEMVFKTGFIAYDNLEESQKDVIIRAYLLCNSGLYDIDRGRFCDAKIKIEECLKLQLSAPALTDEEIMNSYNDLGITYGSMGDYDRGLEFLKKARELLGDKWRENRQKHMLLNMNLARNYYCMREFQQAETHIKRVLEDAEVEHSEIWTYLGYMGLVSLFFRMGNLYAAEEFLKKAKIIINGPSWSKIIPRKAQYAYQAGRLALARGRIQESIDEFTLALEIIELCGMSQGHRSRVRYALCKATEKHILKEGTTLHGCEKFDSPLDGNFEKFDLLVRILDR